MQFRHMISSAAFTVLHTGQVFTRSIVVSFRPSNHAIRPALYQSSPSLSNVRWPIFPETAGSGHGAGVGNPLVSRALIRYCQGVEREGAKA